MEILPSYLKEKNNLEYVLKKIKDANKSLPKEKRIHEIHVDVMDKDFVDGEGVNILDYKKIVEEGFLADIHIMARDVEKYISKITDYQNISITIHVEIENVEEILKKYANKVSLGISLNPDTDIYVLKKYFKYISRVLVMSVYPGKGGQKYIEETTKKLEMLYNIKPEDVKVIVDGGINDLTISNVKADKVVVGSYITDNLDNNLEEKILRLES